jgi:hypothetical protein
MTSLLSGYTSDSVNPQKTVDYLEKNYGNSSFNNDGDTRADTINKFLNDNGVSGKWYTASSSEEYKKLITEAFNEGRPMIVSIGSSGPDPWSSTNGHYFCVIGTYGGNVFTADSSAGDNYCRIENTVDSFFNSVLRIYKQRRLDSR